MPSTEPLAAAAASVGAPAAPPKTVPAAAPADGASGLLVFVLVVAILYFGKEVLMPVTLALVLAFLLAPVVALLRRIRFGRAPAVLLTVILATGVILAIGGVIGTQIAQLTSDLPRYASTVETKVDTVRSFTVGRLSQIADRIGRPNSHAASGRTAPANAPAKPAAPPAPAPAAADSSPLAMVGKYVSPVLSPFATLFIVIIVSIFALLQQEDLRDRLIRLVGSDDLHRTTVAIDDGARRLSRYYIAQISINAAFGVVIGLGLLAIGVPSPVLWALLSGLLRFVPYVGSIISALLPMALAAAVDPGWSMLLWTGGLYLVVEGVTGQAIEPMVYGHSTGLSPFSVIVAAIFWSWVWGPIGLLLSTPLTLCLVVMGRHVKRLEFLDVALGDRPALTPVESFYQRILAGDADEALDHAEALLKERSLSTYYDEVALKALQLAANDCRRGTLEGQQLERVRRTIADLVEGLESQPDAEPVGSQKRGFDEGEQLPTVPRDPIPQGVEPPVPLPWSNPGAVLCVAGRGPLDEAAAQMLVQLLGKHGLSGQLVRHEAVSREAIDGFQAPDAAMACITYLDITGSPAHLRFLIQRLRRRLRPGAPILVGLWPQNEAVLTDKKVQAMVGADYCVSSIGQAVTCCAQAARP